MGFLCQVYNPVSLMAFEDTTDQILSHSRVQALQERRGAKKGIRSRLENYGHPWQKAEF
jgi:hypothetical protein